MKIIEQRYLRGANLYSADPCLLTLLELGRWHEVSSASIAGFSARLLQLLPGLRKRVRADGRPGGFAERLEEGAHFADIVGHLTMELQRLAGNPVMFSQLGEVRDCPGRYRIVCAYASERVVAAAFNGALALTEALASGADYPIGDLRHQLRRLARRAAIGAGTAAVLAAARARGIPSVRITENADLFQLGWGRRQQRLRATLTGAASHVAVGLAADRQLSKIVLEQAGLPVPKGDVAASAGEARRIARRLRGAVVVKPASTSADIREGQGATVCNSDAEIDAAFERARQHGPRVIVERRVEGRRYRVLVAGGVIVAASGHATLAIGGEDVTKDVPEDVSEKLAPSTAGICLRAALAIGLDIAGIDLVCEDIAAPLTAQRGAIIDVNAAPDILIHQPPRDAGAAIVEAMFGNGDGRIPLVAVTGTNGKTTTTRLIAHAASLTGLATGMTTTEGVYIDGVRITEGDCTGYHSARTLLAAPEVEFAVLETARGGILKRGLAFDRCDVSVVLNVTADHLGLDGVETLHDLARVKQVVADAADTVVLNADDAMCVAMAPQLRAGVTLLYFSLDAENPVLLRHLDNGGRAVYLQDHMVILADEGRHVGLFDARKAPVTMGGLARHNIANALAATAALAAAGLRHQDIVQGLLSFVSDGRNNPLRCNVFDVDGIRVVMDFAHNAAAYAALAGMARAMTGARLVGVVSVPGDRRDCDLLEIGAVCAAGFDDLVIYESENRGRQEGDVARLLTLGARRHGADAARLYCKIEVHHAIRFGLKLCRPGDVLVFGCGSSLDELLDAIRRERPDAAARIRDELAAPAMRPGPDRHALPGPGSGSGSGPAARSHVLC